MKLLLSFFLLFSIHYSTGQVQKQTPEKIAVVIGVSNYEAVAPLRNSLNDAYGITQKLTKLGFKVVPILDATLEETNRILDSLKNTLRPEDIFLFFFSGHAIEYNGENYLFLKSSRPNSDNEIPEETLALSNVLDVIKTAKTKTGIILLDACRNNPFLRRLKRSKLKDGLKDIEQPGGVFIGYASGPGKTASGGIRNYSLYTEAILKYIEYRDISIDELFTLVNNEVRIQSNYIQVPHKISSLSENFFFNSTNNNGLLPLEGSYEEYTLAMISKPLIKLLDFKKGNRVNPLELVAYSTINKRIFENNEWLQIYLSLPEDSSWDKVSPIMVDIVHISENNVKTSIYYEHFYSKTGKTRIKIGTDMKPGYYELSIGVYMRSNINQEFPPFYGKKYCFTVL